MASVDINPSELVGLDEYSYSQVGLSTNLGMGYEKLPYKAFNISFNATSSSCVQGGTFSTSGVGLSTSAFLGISFAWSLGTVSASYNISVKHDYFNRSKEVNTKFFKSMGGNSITYMGFKYLSLLTKNHFVISNDDSVIENLQGINTSSKYDSLSKEFLKAKTEKAKENIFEQMGDVINNKNIRIINKDIDTVIDFYSASNIYFRTKKNNSKIDINKRELYIENSKKINIKAVEDEQKKLNLSIEQNNITLSINDSEICSLKEKDFSLYKYIINVDASKTKIFEAVTDDDAQLEIFDSKFLDRLDTLNNIKLG